MLEQINNRADLRNLNIREKNILAQEIREYILDVVSKNGGHLASNLGIVELTLAIHNVFDLKKDKVVWDVGHQSYVHKILTGRKEQLKTLRKLDGLAGFPKTSESETDCFNTGHSSTSISAAMGMAKARDLKKENHSVIAVIGDGALTGGMALEALNHVGSSRTNMIVTVIGRLTVKAVKRIKKSIKQLIIPKMYFEEIGFKYLGPVDGHNIEDLEYILSRAKELDEPVLIHVLTKKGKGYKPAEDNPDKFHGTGPFNIETGESTKKKSKDYSKAFGEKLIELAEKNDRIVAITAAMRDGTGLKDFSTKYPERFFDVGIAEQHALTFAAGLAKEGMIPFVPIYSSFYQRAYDQVIHDICIQKIPVIMCVDRAGCVGNDGETHQGLYDMSFFKLIPNITIMAPKDFEELTKMMEFAIELKAPVVIRYPRGGEADVKFDKHEDIKRGQAEVLQEGKDVTIIGIGKMTATAIRVANEIQKYGLSAEVINARFLKPLDESKITESISNTKFVITIEDGTEIGGLGSSIKELIINKQLEDVKIKCFAYPDEFIKHGSVSELEELYGLDYKNIVNYIKQNIQVTA